VSGASLGQRKQALARHEQPTPVALGIQTENAKTRILGVKKKVVARQQFSHFVFQRHGDISGNG